MKLLTLEQFRSKKKSDTIVVYGSGSSISELTVKDKKILGQFDSISFNWFCKSQIPTTFYLLREQSNMSKRRAKGEKFSNFLRDMDKKAYKKTTLIVHDLSHHSPNVDHYHTEDVLSKFSHNGIVVKDLKFRGNKLHINDWAKIDIFNDGVVHGSCTLTNVLHIVSFLGYSSIVFSGIDLYDSRYFWLDKKNTRYSVINKNKKNSSPHSIAEVTLELIRKFKKQFDIDMRTYNKKSLLSKVIKTF